MSEEVVLTPECSYCHDRYGMMICICEPDELGLSGGWSDDG